MTEPLAVGWKPTPIEIRRNDDGSLDEVVAHPCGFHLEQMASGHWWLRIDQGERYVSVNLHARGKITANVEEGNV